MRNNKLLLTAAAVAFMSLGGAVNAETVIHRETMISPAPVENADMIDFSAFDTNGDGVLTMVEVGAKLFYIFDRDGNEVIDNHEFNRNSVMTITPMKKETLTLVDEYGDGTVEHTTYTYDSFLQASKLMSFSRDYDGLSPREFIDSSFLVLDDNNDHAIDVEEWKESYLSLVMPATAEQERYNE